MSDIKTRVLLPKGEALEACTKVCESELDRELPPYDESLSKDTADLSVFWLKPKDIAPLIAQGQGDIAVVGEDVLLETNAVNVDWGPTISRMSCDGVFAKTPDQDVEPMCRFSILGLAGTGEYKIRRALSAKEFQFTDEIVLPTGNPKTLDEYAIFRGWPLKAYRGFIPSGSVEAYAKLLGAPGVADLVRTGRSAERENLVEVKKLLDIYPRIVTRIER